MQTSRHSNVQLLLIEWRTFRIETREEFRTKEGPVVRCARLNCTLNKKLEKVPKQLMTLLIMLVKISTICDGRCISSDKYPTLLADSLEMSASNHTTYFADSLPSDSTNADTTRINNLPGVKFDDEDNNEDDNQEEVKNNDGQDELANNLSDNGADDALADDEEEEEEEEDEEEFYNKNPVGSMRFNLKDEEFVVDEPKGKVQKLTYKFNDFDDLHALKLNSFYGPQEAEPISSSAIDTTKKQKQAPTEERVLRKREKKKRRKRKKKKKKKKKRKSVEEGKWKSKRLYPLNETTSLDTGEEKLPMASKLKESSERLGAASTIGNIGDNDVCALPTQTGQCITYEAIEWAIRRARRLIAFVPPSGLDSLEPSELTIHSVGELNEWVSRILTMRFGLTQDEINFNLERIDVSQTSLWRWCPRLFRSPVARPCFRPTAFYNAQTIPATPWIRYRTHTGQCNNPNAPHLGSSFMPFARLVEPEYLDGISSIRRSLSSQTHLPPARLVSLNLHPDIGIDSSDHSALFTSWGQLVNHDLALASGARDATGQTGSCCARLLERFDSLEELVSDPLNRVCLPILIGRADPVFGPHDVRCLDFKRSLAGLRPGCSLGPRTQLNLVTSFVDGSFVYGSTRTTSRSLRSRAGGRLDVWDYFRNSDYETATGEPLKPLLPAQVNAPDEECIGRPTRRNLFCFRSGDQRTNQQVPLVVLHTIHTRHHNRLADALSGLNPHWSAARVYEEARHIHVAQIQHILLTEYLPLLLGDKLCAKYQLVESAPGSYWDAYEPDQNPSISQEFAAAAFRQGHSSVARFVYRLAIASRRLKRVYLLRSLFRQPWPLFEPGAMDEFLLGQLETPAASVDPFVSVELTGHLLEEPGEPVGLDLVAINIQRGRDQGVASYNSVRQWCGLSKFNDFNELARVMSNESSHLMATLYESVDDIDLYSGGLSEFPLAGAQVGPTFACVIGSQFKIVRSADRYWFESSLGPHAFTSAQLDSIKQFTLARLVCSNSDELFLIQPLAMRLPHPIYNPLQPCAALPEIDLSLWFEQAPPQVNEQDDDDDDEDEE